MMDEPDIVFNQCRFCLKLIESMGSFSVFGDSDESPMNPLQDFVQKMLSIEFTTENSHVCGDCFSMWRMIQDYLHACAEANKILLTSEELVVRKPWLENDGEKQMLIGVCRVVKKLYHEMEILCRKVQPPIVYYYSSKKEPNTNRRPTKWTKSVRNGKEKRKECNATKETVDMVKQEEPVEIDDSAAFQSDKPIEATKGVNETNSESKEEDDVILDDTVTIVEQPMDHIDLVDSSSDEAQDMTDQAEYVEDASSSWQRMESMHEKEVFKRVCQLCGITTNDMANHLESHIKQLDTQNEQKQNEQQSESDISSSSSSSCCSDTSSSSNSVTETDYKPEKTRTMQGKSNKMNSNLNDLNERSLDVQANPLKCNVCGAEFTSMLTARLHARLHPFKRAYTSKNYLKRVVNKKSK